MSVETYMIIEKIMHVMDVAFNVVPGITIFLLLLLINFMPEDSDTCITRKDGLQDASPTEGEAKNVTLKHPPSHLC